MMSIARHPTHGPKIAKEFGAKKIFRADIFEQLAARRRQSTATCLKPEAQASAA